MITNLKQLRHAIYRLKVKFFYTSRLSAIVRKVVWEELERGKELVGIYKKTQGVFVGYDEKEMTDPVMVNWIRQENRSWNYQDDIIYELNKPAFFEPGKSLGFVLPNFFFVQTKSKAHRHIVPPLRYAFLPLFKRQVIHVAELIHCDGYSGKNLYHLIDDAINPLLMMFQTGLVSRELPVLIHEEVYNLPFVQYFIRNVPSLKNCNWLLQKKGQWICAEKTFKGISSQVHWNSLYQELHTVHEKNPYRHIFLNRRSTYQRTISNLPALVPVLQEYGFEIIYAEDLSYEDQVEIFKEANYVVGIHGAGITNLIHSEIKQLHLLELFSADLKQPHFYWVFNQLGLKYYDTIIGSGFDINWNFTIDPQVFEVQIRRMFMKVDVC